MKIKYSFSRLFLISLIGLVVMICNFKFTNSFNLNVGINSAQAESFNKEISDLYLEANPVLTPDELQAIQMSRQWQAAKGKNKQPKPFIDAAGKINFLYGIYQPTIICAVMQICDLWLEEGENINSVSLGDSIRWIVEPATTGIGEYMRHHIMIKPMDSALETNLVINTDRRSYNIKLKSHRTEYMAQIAFIYPEKALAKFSQLQRIEAHKREDNIIPETKEYLGDLYFNYRIKGDKRLRPVRVYNDGIKTIIEMPKSMLHDETPSTNGWLFKKEQPVMVNYRVHGTRFIVDTVFEYAVLTTGVGRSQQKVTIEKE